VHIITVVLVVLCGCETWSLTFWEESDFKSRVLRIFGPKRGELLEVERTM